MHVAYRVLPLSRFREEAGKSLTWVTREGGQIWLTRHGKAVAALIPLYQLEMLEAVLGLSEAERQERVAMEQVRFRAAKAIELREERRRCAAAGRVEDGSEGRAEGRAEGRTPQAAVAEAPIRQPRAGDDVLILPG